MLSESESSAGPPSPTWSPSQIKRSRVPDHELYEDGFCDTSEDYRGGVSLARSPPKSLIRHVPKLLWLFLGMCCCVCMN